MTPAEVQDTLVKTCALARDLSTKASYGIDVKHFLYEWSSHEVVEEHAQLKAKLEINKNNNSVRQRCSKHMVSLVSLQASASVVMVGLS